MRNIEMAQIPEILTSQDLIKYKFFSCESEIIKALRLKKNNLPHFGFRGKSKYLKKDVLDFLSKKQKNIKHVNLTFQDIKEKNFSCRKNDQYFKIYLKKFIDEFNATFNRFNDFYDSL